MGGWFWNGGLITLYGLCSTEKVPMSFVFSFLKYRTKCVKFLFKQLITSLTLRIIFNHPLKQ